MRTMWVARSLKTFCLKWRTVRFRQDEAVPTPHERWRSTRWCHSGEMLKNASGLGVFWMCRWCLQLIFDPKSLILSVFAAPKRWYGSVRLNCRALSDGLLMVSSIVSFSFEWKHQKSSDLLSAPSSDIMTLMRKDNMVPFYHRSSQLEPSLAEL